MRLGLQLTIRQTNVPQSGYPLTVNVSPMQAESFHGSHARAKTFLEALAAFLQTPESFSRHLWGSRKPQKVFRGLCSIPANSRKFFEAFAAFLQTPKSFSRPLQRSCKLQKVFRETCNSVANAEKFFVRLATVLQTPESFSWDLQQCCKRQKVFCETCNSVANVPKSTLAVTVRYPRHSPEIRNLILSSNTRSVRTPDFKGDQRP